MTSEGTYSHIVSFVLFATVCNLVVKRGENIFFWGGGGGAKNLCEEGKKVRNLQW